MLALRGRQMRNLMLALMVAQGTPMVLMGVPLGLPPKFKYSLGRLNLAEAWQNLQQASIWATVMRTC